MRYATTCGRAPALWGCLRPDEPPDFRQVVSGGAIAVRVSCYTVSEEWRPLVQLRDTVDIEAPPERVWAWLNELPRHYRDWHPAHIDCRYVRGNRLAVGAILRVDERLHGKPHSLTLHADIVVPDRLLRYSGTGFRGAFVLEPVDERTRFTAELEFGTGWPLVGPLFDVVLRRVLAKRLAAFQAHMREEGQNLKQLLEAQPSA